MITCFNIIVNSHSRMHPSELTAQRLGKRVNMQKSFRLCLFCRFLCVHLPPSLPPDLSIDPCAPIHPAPSSTQTASLSAVGVNEGGHCQVVFEKQAVVGFFSFFTQRPNLWERGNISWQLSSAPLAVPCDEFFNGLSGRTGNHYVSKHTHTITFWKTDTSCLWSSPCFPWAPIIWAVGVSSQWMLTLFLLRLCSQKEEGEAMKEAAGERKKKRRGWGRLSGHHVDLIDHSRTWLVCIHAHTNTLNHLINM